MAANGNILIVDDKPRLFDSLSKNFSSYGYSCHYAADNKTTMDHMLNNTIDVVLLDLKLGEYDGIELLKNIKQINTDIPVIIITGYASIETAIETMKLGAKDYIKKPLDFNRLFKIVETAIRNYRLHKTDNTEHIEKPRFITSNAEMNNLILKAAKLAQTELPILIGGEHGTGKELLAEYIHENSNRISNEMIRINCASFPETLLENELFGHEKGAYTGATTTFKGVFERADKSTLFLDEIGDMPLSIQAKILRTLQDGIIRRLGGSSSFEVDVRFIAATNKDLNEQIENGNFREDLYYRLNAASLYIPPLRERKDDIELLVENFLIETASNSQTEVKQVDDGVINTLISHHWPGNVRELKNAINYATAIAPSHTIKHSDLPPHFTKKTPSIRKHTNIREETEKELIQRTLSQTENNKKRTAEILQMSRKTLYSKMKKYEIFQE